MISTKVGYTGGKSANATYRSHPGHAEAIWIDFDTEQISYRDLLEFFFQIHDPTTKNRQGGDVGDDYDQPSFTRAPISAESPKTPSPTSTRRACGPARSSLRSPPPVPFGTPSPSTRTTSSATRRATPATSSGRTGSSHDELAP